jgi:hypothetical protein
MICDHTLTNISDCRGAALNLVAFGQSRFPSNSHPLSPIQHVAPKGLASGIASSHRDASPLRAVQSQLSSHLILPPSSLIRSGLTPMEVRLSRLIFVGLKS